MCVLISTEQEEQVQNDLQSVYPAIKSLKHSCALSAYKLILSVFGPKQKVTESEVLTGQHGEEPSRWPVHI